MNANIEHYPAIDLNPVLTIAKDGTILYSNEASKPLLQETDVERGRRLPSFIADIVRRVVSRNSPEKIEVKAGDKILLVIFSPSPAQECVNISGFDISDQKEVEEKLRKSENKYRNIVETSVEGIWTFNSVSETTYVNEKMAEMLGFKREEMIGTFIWDYADKENKCFFQNRLASRKQGIDEVYEVKLIHKDGTPILFSVSAKGFFDNTGKFEGSVGMITAITDRSRVEEELQESKARVDSIFRSFPVGIGVVVDRIITEANEQLCEMTGYSKEELLGKSALMLYPTLEEYERVGWIKYGMIAECGTGYLETRWRRKDCSVIDILLSSSPIVSGDLSGEITFTALDITTRKHAEEALKKAHETLEEKVKERTLELEKAYNSLKESEGRLAEAQRMAHIGNYENNLVANKLYWSDELYCIFGLTPQEGMTYERFLSYVHPDDRDYVYNSTEKAFNGDVYAISYRILRPDGEERVIHSEREVIFDDKNNPVRIKGTLQDITEITKSEERLRESEEKYRNIVETANEGIAIIDSRGLVTFANEKLLELLGYGAGEIYKKSAYDLVEDAPSLKRKLGDRDKDANDSCELKAVRKDGSKLCAHANFKSLFNDKGEYIGSLGMFTDITMRKEAEEALSIMETARKKEIHHRIKNNLQVISSLLDLQAEQFRNREGISDSEVLDAFRESQDRVISMALIHEELYKGEKSETINFSHYINELVNNLYLSYRVRNDNISLDTDIEKDTFYDMDIAVPLGMIINELVSNSLKHAFPNRDKGEIRIELHRAENGECKIVDNKSNDYMLSVSDNGAGIPEVINIEDLDSLGLQLVITLVDQLDGELELKRDNGTEFTIRFSVTENNQATMTAPKLVDND